MILDYTFAALPVFGGYEHYKINTLVLFCNFDLKKRLIAIPRFDLIYERVNYLVLNGLLPRDASSDGR